MKFAASPALVLAACSSAAVVAAFAPAASPPQRWWWSSSSSSSSTRRRLPAAPLAVSSIENNENSADRIDAAAVVVDDDRGGATTTTSRAVPFLPTPTHLADLDLAGNAGFDPLGMSQSREDVLAYREAEIKHGRLAMLAAVGWPVSELLDRTIADAVGLPAALDPADRVPSLLNGGLEGISPAWWGACLGLTAAIDLYGVERSRSGDPTYFPGNLGLDPLGLYPDDSTGRERMQLAEIKHGRTAMVAVTGFAFQEYATGLGVVDETPFFFHPALLPL